MPENRIKLSVAGLAREDWTTIVVRQGIEQLAGEFRFDYVDRGGELDRPLQFDEGDPCTVSIDGQDVITGHIDDVEITYDANTHNIAISGRGNTGDLVDSSATRPTKWKDTLMQTIAEDLCDPFGIGVVIDETSAEAAAVKFVKFSAKEGETVFEALSRLATMRGMLVVTDDGTQVRFARAGAARSSTPLELGVNVLSGTRSGSQKDRFQIYTYKSQLVGTDKFHGVDATSPKFDVTDEGIDRFRPMIVVAESQGNSDDLKRRAEWERNTRAGKSRRLSYRVQGYFNDEGRLWKQNELVRVKDRFLRIDTDLLIVSVSYEKADKSTTTLQLANPESFDVLVPPGKRSARTKGKSWMEW